MELDVGDSAEIGSYFVANYPPFSAWASDQVPAALMALDRAPSAGSPPLGLYIHIPFCRKRCKFCYFRVYTDKNSSDIEKYIDALVGEVALYADRPGLSGRRFDFVYFGGGTPSFLSSRQLHELVDRINEHWTWQSAREITFECEPGTLQKSKLEAIKKIGVTRLSLGVEHFDDQVLELNGRAHKSPETIRSYQWAREVGFNEINLDLIAGMIGDTEDKWRVTVAKALELEPDCLTIYQMELPHNAEFSREVRQGGLAVPVIDWATKRAWVTYAFEQFESAGYVVSGSYTLIKPDGRSRFLYRDALWHGADMIGVGVASFSYFDGVHFQNHDQWEDYLGHISAGSLPMARAMAITDRQRMIRELVLQLKLGAVEVGYFRKKFKVDIGDEFASVWEDLTRHGFVMVDSDRFVLTREGLLRVDALLPMFFEPQYRGAPDK